MKSTKEKASYCIGLETARNLKHQFADMDTQCLTQGFNDALSETTPKLAQEEIHAILASLKKQVETQQRQFFAKIAEENKKSSEEFMSENKNKEGVVTLTSGLQY